MQKLTDTNRSRAWSQRMLRKQQWVYNESLQKEITATILTSVYNCLLLYFLNAMQLSVFVGKDRAEKWHAKYRKVFCLAHKITYIAAMRYNTIPVIMAMRIHLFPFRTQKLSSSTAKVLDHPRSGRIASCQISIKNDRFQAENGHFSFVLTRFRWPLVYAFASHKSAFNFIKLPLVFSFFGQFFVA